MSIITNFCNSGFSITATNSNDFAEISLIILGFKEDLDIWYEDENHILFGKMCDNSAFIKSYKNNCNCDQFYKIEYGNFDSEIPPDENISNIFNETIFNTTIF